MCGVSYILRISNNIVFQGVSILYLTSNHILISVLLFSSCAGCDGGGWAHTDGRWVWGWRRAPDHAAGEHAVWRRQRHRRWGQLQQLSSAGLQLALEQQGPLQPGEQERQPHLAGVAVEPPRPDSLQPQQNPLPPRHTSKPPDSAATSLTAAAQILLANLQTSP